MPLAGPNSSGALDAVKLVPWSVPEYDSQSMKSAGLKETVLPFRRIV